MISSLFLGISLIGAEWVLYALIILSVISVTVIFERSRFYKKSTQGLSEFRSRIRDAVAAQRLEDVARITEERTRQIGPQTIDLETAMVQDLLQHCKGPQANRAPEILSEIAQDSILRGKSRWDQNLVLLGTIGNNAPFVGLFGTVLGIIKAFHDLSKEASGGGPQTVMSGISEALIATAVGILVAIPAVAAYNLLQRKVKTALTDADAMKSFLIGKLGE